MNPDHAAQQRTHSAISKFCRIGEHAESEKGALWSLSPQLRNSALDRIPSRVRARSGQRWVTGLEQRIDALPGCSIATSRDCLIHVLSGLCLCILMNTLSDTEGLRVSLGNWCGIWLKFWRGRVKFEVNVARFATESFGRRRSHQSSVFQIEGHAIHQARLSNAPVVSVQPNKILFRPS